MVRSSHTIYEKNQSPPDHQSFPSDLMLYFENVNVEKGLENIGQILQFSSQRTSEIHALFISMKADLLAKMGKTRRAIKAYLKAVTILEKKTKLEFALRYVESIKRLTKLLKILANFDEALKYHIKIFKELNSLINTTKTDYHISQESHRGLLKSLTLGSMGHSAMPYLV